MTIDALALLDALAAEAPPAARLHELLTRLVAALGARGARLEATPIGVAPVAIAAVGSLAGHPLQHEAGLTVGGDARLGLDPPALEATPLAQLAAALLARERALERAFTRQRAGLRAVATASHQLNNRLTPLLCHPDPAVRAEGQRVREQLELLRHLRGRAPLSALRRVPQALELVRRLLADAELEGRQVVARWEPAAAARAIGPEQPDLLPVLLEAAAATAGGPLGLEATLAEDAVEVALLAQAAPAELAWAGLGVEPLEGIEATLEQRGAELALRLRLVVRPRAVLVRGAACAVAARLRDRLGLAGVELHEGGPIEVERALVAGGPEPWAILFAEEVTSAAPTLRRALLRERPALASRCVQLDPDGLPRDGRSPDPDAIDLADLLR